MSHFSHVPGERRRVLNAHAIRSRGQGARHVLYWMTATRRTRANFALQRALGLADELGLPLVVLEALSVSHPHATARVAAEVVSGMADNRAAFAAHRRRIGPSAPRYLAYLEPSPGAGNGLVEALAAEAAIVLGDAYPAYFLPKVHRAVAARISVPLELVDSATLVPMSTAPKAFARAHDFRRWLHQRLPEELGRGPVLDPLDLMEPGTSTADRNHHLTALLAPWPMLLDSERDQEADAYDLQHALASLPIDHGVAAPDEPTGPLAARARLGDFLAGDLGTYADKRTKLGATSYLSPALHYGHLGPHEVLADLFEVEPWHPDDIEPSLGGRRAGWWGLSPGAESWLDQLCTWRELGYNQALFDPQGTRYAGLPAWAQKTLAEHADDPRPWTYDRASFEAAATHDELWNAAQRQLVRDGRIEGYLRMLWGKLILEWSASPEEAFETCVALNDRYARDGRDPNSYSAIAWVFGKFDRAWGPERQVFGKVRCMTSASSMRKLRLADYLAEYGGLLGAGRG
ncbi:MAG: deoxyribodipyrimidine photolyase [Planctomycetota bacterium]|nr:deoxyribodipyrimidine photolyase [Planctomycetota bacterium]